MSTFGMRVICLYQHEIYEAFRSGTIEIWVHLRLAESTHPATPSAGSPTAATQQRIEVRRSVRSHDRRSEALLRERLPEQQREAVVSCRDGPRVELHPDAQGGRDVPGVERGLGDQLRDEYVD